MSPKMTKAHFELIAATIWHLTKNQAPDYPALVSQPTRLAIAVRFANELEHTNPSFDRARFVAAATRED